MNLLKKIIRLIAAGACLAVAAACSDSVPGNAVSSGTLPHIFPDYTNVTIPRNIAPLNFIVRGDSIDAVTVAAGGEVISSRGDAKAVFDLGKWHDMLGEHAGKDITVSVYTRSGTDGGHAIRTSHGTWPTIPLILILHTALSSPTTRCGTMWSFSSDALRISQCATSPTITCRRTDA